MEIESKSLACISEPSSECCETLELLGLDLELRLPLLLEEESEFKLSVLLEEDSDSDKNSGRFSHSFSCLL